MPTFFQQNPSTGISIQGSDYSESWGDYFIVLVATDTKSGTSNSLFVLEVITGTDCTRAAVVIPGQIDDISYDIGATAMIITMPIPIDQASGDTGVSNVCSPILNNLFLTSRFIRI